MFAINYRRESGKGSPEAMYRVIELLKRPDLKAAVFSSSPSAADGSEAIEDGTKESWPYFSAVIRVDDAVFIFDGPELTAARVPNDGLVRRILDVAEVTANVYFTRATSVGFTAQMLPEVAARRFGAGELTSFTQATRSEYWHLLGTGTPESDFDTLRKK